MVTMVIEPLAPRGQPKTAADAAALERYDRVARVPIILAAILPLILAPESGHWVGLVVDIGSWLVFLVDFVIHERRLSNYLGTRLGKFDLLVVILDGSVVPAARCAARRVRRRAAAGPPGPSAIASRGAKRLFERLGRVVLVALAVVFVGAAVAYYAEHPTNPEFKTFGDSLWWAIVTLTTVGYGDIVPETTAGRWAAVFIMVTGVAVLGLLGRYVSPASFASGRTQMHAPTHRPRPSPPMRRPPTPVIRRKSCVSLPLCERRSRCSTNES